MRVVKSYLHVCFHEWCSCFDQVMTDGPVTQSCSLVKNRLPAGGPSTFKERHREEDKSNWYLLGAKHLWWCWIPLFLHCLFSLVYFLECLLHPLTDLSGTSSKRATRLKVMFLKKIRVFQTLSPASSTEKNQRVKDKYLYELHKYLNCKLSFLNKDTHDRTHFRWSVTSSMSLGAAKEEIRGYSWRWK